MKPHQRQLLRRVGVLAGASALTITTLAATATPAQAHPAGDRAVSAASTWLKGQLTAGLVYNDQFGGFNDYGLSADFAFALHAVGEEAAASAIADAIEPGSESWATGAPFAPDRVYAGSVAKLVSLVQATGQDPAAYNGTDQVVRLEGLVSGAAPLAGRLEDAGVDPDDQYDADFVNVIGQSFAARALTTADSARAGDATAFLLDQQCNDGFFRATLSDKASPAQGCVEGTDTGSVDTTALTIVNILDTPGASTRARGAAALAATWLKSQQSSDGSFSAGASEGYNANTTGLAAWALAEAGDTTSATKAARWLRGVQIADLAPCATTLAADNGGLAYKPGILAEAQKSGIAASARDQYRRATAQALPALAYVPEATGVPAISAPATAVEKSTVTVNVAGLGAGEPACVSLGGQATKVTGTGSTVPVTFTLPAGAATHTFRLTTLAGSTTASTTSTVVTVTPPAAPVVGKLAAAKVEKVKNNAFRLAITCDSDEACTGKLKVRSVGKVTLANGKTRTLVLAKSSYSVKPGKKATVKLTLTKPARKVLGSKRLRVEAVQTARGAEPTSTKFWLRRK